MFLGLTYTRIVYLITGRASWSVESTLKDSHTDYFATKLSGAGLGGSNEDEKLWRHHDRREVVLHQIMLAKFWDLNKGPSFPFFTFGRLYQNLLPPKAAPLSQTPLSLFDFSLWILFDAWDEDWIEVLAGDDVDWIGVDRYGTPVKSFRSSTRGNDSRVQNGKACRQCLHSYLCSNRPDYLVNYSWRMEPQWDICLVPSAQRH